MTPKKLLSEGSRETRKGNSNRLALPLVVLGRSLLLMKASLAGLLFNCSLLFPYTIDVFCLLRPPSTVTLGSPDLHGHQIMGTGAGTA